jgi:DNA invertase Pin-like site-specific DNA recombinase
MPSDRKNKMRGRPGTGGHLPRATAFTGTSATLELIAELGHPHIELAGSAQLMIWPVHSDGDGILFGRLSGREVAGGETAMGQIHPLRALASNLDLHPRLIVMSTDNSGMRRYEERPDFALLEEAVDIGWVRWVAWRSPDRAGRDILPVETHYDMLRRNHIDLYLHTLGRKVNWKTDRIILRALGMVSAEEASAITDRTHTAIRTRYVDEGRGYPSAKRFGFRRNPATLYLEPDPEQWEHVKRIHFDYADCSTERRGGTRKLHERLETMGCHISYRHIMKILRDPIYVTGEFTSTVNGETIPQRPIPLDDPIPPEIFQRNQELLELRRSHEKTTQIGDFALNGIPITHEPCAHLHDPRGRGPKIKGRTLRGVHAYRHWPWMPAACRGFVLDREELEAAVVGAVRKHVDRPSLRTAWLERRQRESRGFTTTLLDAGQKRNLRRRIADRERQKAELTKRFLNRLAANEVPNEHAYWQLVGAIDADIEQLETRLDHAETEPSVSTKVDTDDLEEAVHLILTTDLPAAAGDRVRRAALLKTLIHRIEIASPKSGRISVNVELAL